MTVCFCYRRLREGIFNIKCLAMLKYLSMYIVVVHRSSKTSTNQSDVIIRSDDRFLNLVVDSDSILSKIYICLTLFFGCFFLVSILTKILQFYPSWVFFCPHTDKHLAVLSKRIFGLVYYLSTSRNSPFYIRCYTYGKRSFVLF